MKFSRFFLMLLVTSITALTLSSCETAYPYGAPPQACYNRPAYPVQSSVIITPSYYPNYGYGYWYRGNYCPYRNGYYFRNGCYYRGGPSYYNNGRWNGPHCHNNGNGNGNWQNNGNYYRGNGW